MSIDLTTRYGSLTLRSPIVVGACPMSVDEQTRIAIESSGAGAIVLPSLFEEQISLWNQSRGKSLSDQEQQRVTQCNALAEATYCGNAETYLSIVNRASEQMHIPVIASLNGESEGNWLDFAGEVEEAGAAAIELAVHHSDALHQSGPRQIEESLVRLVTNINQAISIPLYLKLERDYTSLGHLSRQLSSGCQGLVMYGRKPNVEICLDSLSVRTHWGLTEPGSINQSLGEIMRVHSSCPTMSLAACGGISSSEDVIRSLLAGADVAMVTSAIYRHGPDVIRTMNDGLMEYMNQHQLTSIVELQEQRPLEFDQGAQRNAYAKALSSRIDPPADSNSNFHGDRYGHLDRRSAEQAGH
ncbi:Dihydroorotate dehydrogenase B (NAD(+)), catalytic subunit [Rubripirellula tenax]|uniref:Dihydroorotate dehydrogenase B (NAD(+)), catalytic subunit n=1 Tax=Rubripirellula tenax TaxID=2528015 RepID=A0A5C6EC35_9BACT|nr:dihydroorotate dehydrogenase [Rubripirellula tenax]TWU47343.1 Dihydroorotate dehydrogenase B (NAD(+)), catalytic subunit [Rubripirellula tenax]